jgi:hypothetical protein
LILLAVAMRYSILDDAAITFSREFYRALASGMSVDVAVADITSARKLLTNRSYGVSYHLCSG